MIGDVAIENELAMIDAGYTLGTCFYTDPSILELERSAIFAKCWQFALHESALPEWGSFELARR